MKLNMMKEKRYTIAINLSIILLFVVFILQSSIAQSTSVKPNIVWLVTEDNSKHFVKLFDQNGAAMSNVEKLAKNGIVFTNAFSNAPVCSVARSTLITGCYAPRIGAQYHRRMELVPLPDGLKMFPAYLKKAGYYTSNNSKEDYNLIKSDEVWDESSKTATYQNRSEGQPFFHVQNFSITHEGRLHFSNEEMQDTDLKAVAQRIKPFPYHPNTQLYRFTYQRYLSLHRNADKAIGQFIDQMEKDGVMDDTIIFYYGDHGGVLPRSKGYIYESGLNVPLVVYVPEKWKDLTPISVGSHTDAFIEFIDFAPTVLHLANIPIPQQMDGKAFLGSEISMHTLDQDNSTFSYADRFDEKYDLVRAVRKGKFKYMRNYQPFNIDALFNFYRYKMLAYKEWFQLFNEGKLDDAQKQFFQRRQTECLFDIENDPHEVQNLADDPTYRKVLEELRIDLQDHVKSMPDLSFYPEPYFIENGMDNPVQFGQEHKDDIAKLIDIADLSLLSFSKAKKGIGKALNSKNPWQRYWGLIVCSSFGERATTCHKKARQLLNKDPVALVRTRALEFLLLNGETVDENLIIDIIKSARSETEANLILNTIALLKMVRPDFRITIPREIFNSSWFKTENSLVSRRYDFIHEQ